jgi:hypothetical protein
MKPIPADLRKSLIIVWVILSVSVACAIASPYVFSQGHILQVIPQCLAKIQNDVPCSLCGMSRAFISMSRGELGDAVRYNSWSPQLFLIFTINTLLFLAKTTKFLISCRVKNGNEFRLPPLKNPGRESCRS